MAQVDLHLHTNYSDGTLSPSELVGLCAQRGLRVIALTDHDSTEGVREAMEAAWAFPALELIPGIELSTDVPGSEIHVLGYFVDREDASFQRALARLREGREDRARGIVEKLSSVGVEVSWERVKELSGGGAIGRPHIAQALVEAGYVEYPREAFDKYLGRNGPAYVGRVKLTPNEAVEMLVANGALPVLAHPTFFTEDAEKLKATLVDLKRSGLVGMEVHYGGYTSEQVDELAGVAAELGIVPCGGSDYHASGNPGEPEPGTAGPPMDTVDALRELKSAVRATRA